MPMNARLLRPLASGFNPKRISGLEGWWDGSDSATVTLDGNNNVQELRDKSGKGRNMAQTTANNRPAVSATINGRTVMTFDGSSDFLATTGTVNFTQWTAFTVVKPGRLEAGGEGILTTDPLSAPRGPQIMRWAGTTYQSVGFPTSTPIVESAATAAAIGVIRLVSVVQTASALEMWIDNSSNGSSVGGQQAYAARMAIGIAIYNAANDSGSGFMSGDLGEVIYYGRALTTDERYKVQNYLAQRWGITL